MTASPAVPFEHSMQEKLLITLGDSWTEGIGSYSPESLTEYHQHGDLTKLQNANVVWAAEYSWPQVLARMLDSDLINLGYRGAANSAHVKWLFDQVIDPAYKQVQIVWLLSDPFRFSFYNVENEHSRDNVLNFAPAALIHNRTTRAPVFKSLAENYLAVMDFEGVIKETHFYIHVMENYCELKGYKLAIGNAFTSTPFDSLYSVHRNQSYASMREFLGDKLETTSPVCAHPNSLGYQLIAEELARILEQNREAPSAKL